jgi:WD40 repeat protein
MDSIIPIWSVAFSPDGLIIAGGGEDHMVYLWDANTGQRLKTLSGHTNAITLVTFSPDGKTVASGSNDYTIHLWDVDKGLCTKILQGHTDRVSTVAFSPNGRTIASGSQDGAIKLWSAKTGRCLDTLRSNRPYERMNITGVRGITEAQKTMLEKLGAVEGEGELH